MAGASKNKASAKAQADAFGADDDNVAGPAGSGAEEASLLPIEIAARELEKAQREEEEEAARELARETAVESREVFHLPTAEEREEEVKRAEEGVPVPPRELRSRIDGCLEVLADFKRLREPGRSRSDYLEQLQLDCGEYFSYNPELCEMLVSQFPPAEAVDFLEASERERPLVIRCNTLKTRRKELARVLIKRGVVLEPLAKWSKVGLKITESTVPIGATPEYLSGHYMIQSAASMGPVMALAPQPGERIVDMSAAPGGKTTYIAQLMQNEGVVVANDCNAKRHKATAANLQRLGVRNAIVAVGDGRTFPRTMRGFDRALLDAPCSGTGVISRDPSVKVSRDRKDIQRTSHLQRELLLAAIDAVDANSKTGGVVVYSTCSVTIEENEKVVDYALRKRHVKLIDTGLDHGRPGFGRHQSARFHPTMPLTRRFYPHVHNMDGFYVAKFKKLSNAIPSKDDAEEEQEEDEEEAEEAERMDAENKAEEEDGEAKADEDEEDEEDDEEDEEDEEDEDAAEEEGEDEEEKAPAPARKGKGGVTGKKRKLSSEDQAREKIRACLQAKREGKKSVLRLTDAKAKKPKKKKKKGTHS